MLLLGGCTSGPDWERPSAWTPAGWFARRPAVPSVLEQPPDPAWWAGFDDPVLTGLMGRVAASSPDVREAASRIMAARALRGNGGGPEAVAGAAYSRERLSERGVLRLLEPPGVDLPARGRDGFDLFRAGVDAAWELNLWGRVARAEEAADAAIEASREMRRAALVSVMAEVALHYMDLRGAQAVRRATEEAIPRVRVLARGAGFGAANAAAQVALLEAALPAIEATEARLANRIALLLAQPPGALHDTLSPPRPVPLPPASVSAGVPSELAQRRPDIRAAEARLHAATAAIGVAEADFFPRIVLSGRVALQALQLRDLGWGALTYGVGPGVSIPLFEGGRLRATLDLRRAGQQEAAIGYQRVVLQAFHEVDDALTALQAEQRRLTALNAAVGASREAVRRARTPAERLAAEQDALSAELQQAQSSAALPAGIVRLYKALGGGWEGAFPRSADAAAPR